MADEHKLTPEQEREAIDAIVARITTGGTGTAEFTTATLKGDSGICKYRDVILLIIKEALKHIPHLPGWIENQLLKLVKGALDKHCQNAGAQ